MPPPLLMHIFALHMSVMRVHCHELCRAGSQDVKNLVVGISIVMFATLIVVLKRGDSLVSTHHTMHANSSSFEVFEYA